MKDFSAKGRKGLKQMLRRVQRDVILDEMFLNTLTISPSADFGPAGTNTWE
jgi:hypothetical protein